MADLIQRAEVEWAEVEADEGAELMERPVRMIAYSGGAIGRDSKGRPTIVDVKGLTIEPNMPLLVSHDEDQIAGNATNVSAESGALAVDGVVYCDEEAGAKVRRYAARPRFKWQASMRFVPERTALLAEGETREVNGRTFSGPAVIVEASRLRECSFVPLGRDPATSAEVFSALSEEERPMADTPKPAELVELNKRFSARPQFVVQAGLEQWSMDRAEKEWAALEASEAKAEADRLKAEAAEREQAWAAEKAKLEAEAAEARGKLEQISNRGHEGVGFSEFGGSGKTATDKPGEAPKTDEELWAAEVPEEWRESYTLDAWKAYRKAAKKGQVRILRVSGERE